MSVLEINGPPDLHNNLKQSNLVTLDVDRSKYPHPQADVFYYGSDNQWVFDSYVVETKMESDPVKHPSYGTHFKEVSHTSDGNDYQLQVTEPIKRRTDIPLVFTSAWLTSDRGHNRHTAQKFAELGYPVVFIGPEGNHRPGLIQTLGKLTLGLPWEASKMLKNDMARSSHNIHQILDSTSDKYGLDPSNVVLFGESRGAMVGMGIEAFAQQHNRNVVYAELLAPCFPEPASFSDLPRYFPQLKHEKDHLKEVATGISQAYRRFAASTINASPLSVAHQITMLGKLMSGQAGEMAREIPNNRHATLITFDSDLVSKPLVWERIFAHNPYVESHRLPGAHMTIAEPNTLKFVLGHIASLMTELESTNDKPENIDFHQIHLP